MTDYRELVPFVIKHEGGFVNDPADSGGATNRGITFGTYKALCKKVLRVFPTWEHFKTITPFEAGLFIKYFWDKATHNNEIEEQPIAEMITTWYWGSGKFGLKEWQRFLNEEYNMTLIIDGMVGRKTVEATNKLDGQILFNNGIKRRGEFFDALAARRKKDKRFLKGWHNRLERFSKKHELYNWK